MPESSQLSQTTRYAGLFRRLFAIFYDMFLLTAIFFIVSGIFTALNSGEAVETNGPAHSLLMLFLAAASFLYFGWFWTHGGQTLGMQTWRIRLQTEDGNVISWKLAAIRYLTALVSWCGIGMGFIWSLFNKKKQGWHDIATHSVLVDLR